MSARSLAGPVARLALKGALAVVGALLNVGSLVDPRIRRCITRDLVFEISTGDGVTRHWLFDGERRRASSRTGAVARPDAALHFRDSRTALAVLAGDAAAAHAAVVSGAMRMEGSSATALWFADLVETLLTTGRRRRRRTVLPGGRTAHDAACPASRFITVEPAARALDPTWPAAWQQRAKLTVVRVPAGEPVKAL